MSASLDLSLDYLPRLPRRKDWRIGCAGAGFIMRDCHLVAYRQAGFNPVAVASRHPERAREVAEARGVPRWYPSTLRSLATLTLSTLPATARPSHTLSSNSCLLKSRPGFDTK